MSADRKRYCVFGCQALFTSRVPLHRFPNPEKRQDLFDKWVSAVGDSLKERNPQKIYATKRVCDHHFMPCHKIDRNRLIPSAVPCYQLFCVQQSFTTFVKTDHSYCLPKRGSLPLGDITNISGGFPTHGDSIIQPLILPGCSGDQAAIEKSTQKFDADRTVKLTLKKTRANKEKQMQSEIRRLRLKIKSFKLKVQHMEKVSVKKDFERLTRNLSETSKLFTRMQCLEGQKMKKGRRFTLKEKILSLSLFKKSPKGYKLMTKYFTLPSTKTLKSLLSGIKISPGINESIFKELKNTASKMSQQDRLCTLIFDEMSLNPQIQYNAFTDELVGFENYGTEKTEKIANHVLVFMIKGVKKNFKQPVAYYFNQTLKSIKLKEIILEVICNVQATGLNIIATVCDQSSANVSAINSLIADAKTAYFQAGKEWRHDIIKVKNYEIIPLFDIPHLLKGIRNNLLNKDMQYCHENEIKIVKWQYFQRVYEADKMHGELCNLPKLTDEHLDPGKIRKIKVKNAAQVLSHSMAVATYNLSARGDINPECRDLIPFVLLIDKLFDSFNSLTFSAPNGKIYKAAVKRNSPHHELWQDALEMMKSIKFIVQRSDGENHVKNVPTINNFIRTIEGFKALWQLLFRKYSFDAMLTRNFNQDPLENFFGCIRSLGARNIMPNCVGFEGAFKTLLLNNFNSNHSVQANCEEDQNDCLQSISFLLKRQEKNKSPSESQNIVIDQPLNFLQNNDSILDSGADQRIYVCGWALRKTLKRVVKGCKKCKSKLLGDPDKDLYKYMRNKEFFKTKQWLCYPSEGLVAYFQEIQNMTIAFLQSECFKKQIKDRIKAFIDLFSESSFLDCHKHKENFKKNFIDTSCNIIIYSWCRSINRILEGKIKYDGTDKTKKAAQEYYNKHKCKQ